MATSNVFWSLVIQDFKCSKNRKQRFSKAWRMTYLIIIILAAIGYATYSAMQKNANFSGIWFFSLGMPFAVFGISISLISREWRNNTAAWWLSLPYSRRKLVLAKWVAVMLRSIYLETAMFLIAAVLSLYSIALQNDLTSTFLLPFIANGSRWYLLLIAVTPFVSALGILLAVIKKSKARPIIPLMWVIFILFWNVVIVHGNGWLTINDRQASIAFSLSHFVILAISWGLAYVLIHVGSYLLNRHLEM